MHNEVNKNTATCLEKSFGNIAIAADFCMQMPFFHVTDFSRAKIVVSDL